MMHVTVTFVKVWKDCWSRQGYNSQPLDWLRVKIQVSTNPSLLKLQLSLNVINTPERRPDRKGYSPDKTKVRKGNNSVILFKQSYGSYTLHSLSMCFTIERNVIRYHPVVLKLFSGQKTVTKSNNYVGS